MNRRTQPGFTLYELLITITIVGVVLSLGIPNLAAYRQNSRMISTANDYHAAFHLARSEASRAKTFISICASANSMTVAPTCGGTWDQGYIVFVDLDGNIQVGVGDSVLRAHPAVEQGVSFVVPNAATYFSFAATGLGRANVGGNPAVSQVFMCDARGNQTAAGGRSAARMFVATPMGRATIVSDEGDIGTALSLAGATCP